VTRSVVDVADGWPDPGLGPHRSAPALDRVLSAHDLMDAFAEAADRGVRPSGIQRIVPDLGRLSPSYSARDRPPKAALDVCDCRESAGRVTRT
jgi:hypothetical protein